MKVVIAKKWHETSRLGEATFTGVPVLVPDDFPAKAGAHVNIDQKKMRDAAVSGDAIQRMELEIAKKWAISFDEKKRPLASITPDEIYGILLVLGISKTEFAKILKVSKASVTKYIDGSLKPVPPVAFLMVIYLAAELAKPGSVPALVKDEATLFKGLAPSVPAPRFAFKGAA